MREGCQLNIRPSSSCGHCAMQVYRRKGGGPTAHEMRSRRKYGGKVAMFGERGLAKVRGANGR